MIGRTISQYKIVAKLGEGGIGVVYKAEDTKLDRIVALKFLSPDATGDDLDRERLANEAKAAAALNHPNICTVYEIGEVAGQVFISMEYVPGMTLKDQMEAGSLSAEEAVEVAIQVSDALREAHEQRVVHRDIKPGNILIGARGRVKLSDFGLAKTRRVETPAGKEAIGGTLAYMSPEQARGEDVDCRTDVWSLGVVLYEMLAGRRPFEGDYEEAIVYSILNLDPEGPASAKREVPRRLQEIVIKALAKDPDFRYASAAEMHADLTALRSAMRLGPPSRETGGEGIPSIAVLPFADMSPDKDQEYFCDGLADEIINALSHLGGLRVVSRSSAFTFKDKALDVREIGKKLNASTVLEGSVRKSGATVRVTAQLVSVEDGFQLWSDKFDREMKDVFAIQDEISLAIVENLKPRLMIGERDKVLERHTKDVGAYNHYLKGRWFWDKRTESALKKAIFYFKLAVDKDPNYSQAYAGLADAYSDLPTYSSYPPASAYPKAKEAALQAIEIDESHAEPHASLGLIKTDYEWDWEGAERELKRAIELNPDYSTAHHWYSLLFMWLGRWQEAIAEIESAFELDPLCLVTSRSKGMVLSVAGNLDEAVEVLQHTLELEPGFIFTRLLLGQTYLRKRAFDKALAEFISEREVLGSQSPYLEGWIGVAYALMGDEESARMALRKIKGMSNTKYVPPFKIGMLHLVLGEKDPGFRFLNVAFSERDVWMRTLRVRQPFFPESVRTDRRMIELLEKMRFSTDVGRPPQQRPPR